MKRGFTLIELLVVVAIIGILSSIVLASLNTARIKQCIALEKRDEMTEECRERLSGIDEATLDEYRNDAGEFKEKVKYPQSCDEFGNVKAADLPVRCYEYYKINKPQ